MNDMKNLSFATRLRFAIAGLAYAVAAVLAMAAFGAVMGSLGHRIRPIHLKRVMQGFGMVAIALGLLWVARGWPH